MWWVVCGWVLKPTLMFSLSGLTIGLKGYAAFETEFTCAQWMNAKQKYPDFNGLLNQELKKAIYLWKKQDIARSIGNSLHYYLNVKYWRHSSTSNIESISNIVRVLSSGSLSNFSLLVFEDHTYQIEAFYGAWNPQKTIFVLASCPQSLVHSLVHSPQSCPQSRVQQSLVPSLVPRLAPSIGKSYISNLIILLYMEALEKFALGSSPQSIGYNVVLSTQYISLG